MDEEIKPAFYAVIPADVRYDSSLKPNAKLLYGEITALCNEKGYCWAGNDYFAKLYGVGLKTISVWISELVAKKYLNREIIYETDTKQVKARILSLPLPYPQKNGELSIKKWIPSPEKKGEGVTPSNEELTEENEETTLSRKKRIPLPKKKEENITYEYISNIFNNTNDEILKNKTEFIPLIVDWIDYKQKEKNQKYKTEKSLSACIKKLINFSGGDFKIAKEIVETAMANLWEGFYKPNNSNLVKPITVDFTPSGKNETKYGGY